MVDIWQVILITYCIVSTFVSIFIAITDLVGDGSEPITLDSFLIYRLIYNDKLTIFGKIFLSILLFIAFPLIALGGIVGMLCIKK